MEKQKRQVLIMLLALAVLAAGLFGLKKYNDLQAQKPLESSNTILINIPKDDVISMSYNYEGETISLEKEDGVWYVANYSSRKVKDRYINGMVTGMAQLSVTRTLEHVTDLSQYGLDNPWRTITYSTYLQKYTVYVGDKNSLAKGYYIMLPDKPDTVYVLPQAYVNRFNYKAADILDDEEQEGETE